jgi:hypothetical protein
VGLRLDRAANRPARSRRKTVDRSVTTLYTEDNG